MQIYDLHTKHEFEGFWWLAGSEKKFPGRLVLCPTEIKLCIWGEKPEIAGLSGYDGQENGTPLLGQSTDGTLFTLNDGFCLGATYCTGYTAEKASQQSSATFVANTCFIGEHVLSDQEIDADLYVTFPNLGEWFRYNPYKQRSKTKESGMVQEIYCYHPDSLLNISIPSLKTNLRSWHSISNSAGSFKGFESECTVYLILEAGHNISPMNAINYVREITLLWTLLIGTVIYPETIFFRKNNTLTRESNSLYIYIPLDAAKNNQSIHPADMTTDYTLLKDKMGLIINSWFEERVEMAAIRNLFLKSYQTHTHRQYDITQFLNYVTILEIIERTSPPILPKEVTQRLRKKLAAVIKEEVDASIQERLIDRLNYIHESRLQEKITLIAESLLPTTRAAFSILDKEFIPRIVKTRNYYTHYDEKLSQSKKVISETERMNVIDQLGVLVMLLLLKRAGLDEDTIIKRIKNTWRHNHALRSIEKINL